MTSSVVLDMFRRAAGEPMARRTTPTSNLQKAMTKTRIARDLVEHMNPPAQGRKKLADGRSLFDVVIEFNRDFPGGAAAAREFVRTVSELKPDDPIAEPKAFSMGFAFDDEADDATADTDSDSLEDDELRNALQAPAQLDFQRSQWTDMYLFARLPRDAIRVLSSWTMSNGMPLVYKIWLDHEVKRCVFESVRTVKGDAAQAAFAAAGKGIVWAIADTGIDQNVPHFNTLDTLKLPNGLQHYDFTETYTSAADASAGALVDTDGHGTHVAGILAGRTSLKDMPASYDISEICIRTSILEEDGTTRNVDEPHEGIISGIAPYCKLVSLKVLSRNDQGRMSNLLAAIGFIQRSNDNGRTLKIHGLNLSLGYSFDPAWFAAGQSPLCVEINRLVRSGVVVVAAAGNAGYGTVNQYSGKAERASHAGTIMDPGNADMAITVGSTHRDMPHAYGVSYFSSKGPTADGRMKPDLVAPGERIVSCALPDRTRPTVALFREDSGTSQASPHVSAAIAAFLSVRREFLGQTERVKEIFLSSSTDLRRRVEYQGAGLIDLMRALQSV